MAIVHDHEPCGRCHQRDRQAGYSRCRQCRQTENEASRDLYVYLKRQGLCPHCGKKPAKDRIFCRRCLDYSANRNRRIKRAWIKAGLCTRCGRKPVKAGRCKLHQRKYEVGAPRSPFGRALTPGERLERWRAKQISRGNCRTCGQKAYQDPITGKVRLLCKKHLDKAARTTQQRRAKRVRQGRRNS